MSGVEKCSHSSDAVIFSAASKRGIAILDIDSQQGLHTNNDSYATWERLASDFAYHLMLNRRHAGSKSVKRG